MIEGHKMPEPTPHQKDDPIVFPVEKRKIFVFGSNEAGRHGKGAALYAYRNHGAIYGQGSGLQGDSYAIPTKDKKLITLSLENIQRHIHVFMTFSSLYPDWDFIVTNIGCGLAGYTPEQIAPMFKTCKDRPNLHFSKEFKNVFNRKLSS
jgi:hypothetical protein